MSTIKLELTLEVRSEDMERLTTALQESGEQAYFVIGDEVFGLSDEDDNDLSFLG